MSIPNYRPQLPIEPRIRPFAQEAGAVHPFRHSVTLLDCLRVAAPAKAGLKNLTQPSNTKPNGLPNRNLNPITWSICMLKCLHTPLTLLTRRRGRDDHLAIRDRFFRTNLDTDDLRKLLRLRGDGSFWMRVMEVAIAFRRICCNIF